MQTIQFKYKDATFFAKMTGANYAGFLQSRRQPHCYRRLTNIEIGQPEKWLEGHLGVP
jgi:hypothetical protein